MEMLCASFRHVTLYKPTHSRITNSERYLVCVGFDARFEPSESCADWCRATREVIDALTMRQVVALEDALRLL